MPLDLGFGEAGIASRASTSYFDSAETGRRWQKGPDVGLVFGAFTKLNIVQNSCERAVDDRLL